MPRPPPRRRPRAHPQVPHDHPRACASPRTGAPWAMGCLRESVVPRLPSFVVTCYSSILLPPRKGEKSVRLRYASICLSRGGGLALTHLLAGSTGGSYIRDSSIRGVDRVARHLTQTASSDSSKARKGAQGGSLPPPCKDAATRPCSLPCPLSCMHAWPVCGQPSTGLAGYAAQADR